MIGSSGDRAIGSSGHLMAPLSYRITRSPDHPITRSSVAVVGGGLAGLSAGCALAEAGFKVTMYERRPYVGGRASSYEHPGTGEVVDNCQHVLLGCCTNLIDFYRRVGVCDKIRWFDDLTFIEPGGRTNRLGPSFLPAPLHAAPAFFRARHLRLSDKVAVARGLITMLSGPAEDSQESFLEWLRRRRQTEPAIERFWKPVLVSALNEDLELVSVRYAVQVFRESFLKSAAAGRVGVPSIPLSELYSSAVVYIQSRGGRALLRSAANAVEAAGDAVNIRDEAGAQDFDFAVLAVPFQAAAGLLPPGSLADPLRQRLQHFESSPITGIHLWFDREITPLPHAVLLDRTIQWMFQKSKFQENRESAGSYIELVVSASKNLVKKSREEILALAQQELAEFFPLAKAAKVMKAAVIKEIHATYSVQPGLDQFRPEAKTPWPRLFLAGDWTATDWPATMEGAVRSGYLAAEALMDSIGQRKRFLVDDLPATGLMRLVNS